MLNKPRASVGSRRGVWRLEWHSSGFPVMRIINTTTCSVDAMASILDALGAVDQIRISSHSAFIRVLQCLHSAMDSHNLMSPEPGCCSACIQVLIHYFMSPEPGCCNACIQVLAHLFHVN